LIRNVWVIEKVSGRCLFHFCHEKELKEADLISGFLSALTSFSEAELEGEKLSVVETEGRKWIYRYVDPLIFVVTGAKGDPESHLKAQVSYLANSFLDTFPELKGEKGRGYLGEWSGERSQFNKFEPLVAQLVTQWQEVDHVNKAAKAQDVTEIYQRIFDAVFSGAVKYKDKICIEFQKALKDLEGKCGAQIPFSYSGPRPTLDLMSIDVFSMNYEKLKEELGLLLTRLMKTLKDRLPGGEAEKIMRAKVVPIMKSDWKRIDVYNIDPILVSLL
jgi:hypothetical protein